MAEPYVVPGRVDSALGPERECRELLCKIGEFRSGNRVRISARMAFGSFVVVRVVPSQNPRAFRNRFCFYALGP
jgi:hypothetical protein